VDGLDVPLLTPAIPEGLPRRHEAAAQCGFTDEARPPDLVEKLALRDNAVVMLHQESEDVENLPLERTGVACPAELEETEVELEVIERVDHLWKCGTAPPTDNSAGSLRNLQKTFR
jgi:hypothetical protein